MRKLFLTTALLSGLCAFTLAFGGETKAQRLLLIGQGPDGHPPASHEFMAGVRVMQKLLAPVAGLETVVVKADEPWTEGPGLIDKADGVVLFVTQGAQWMQIEPRRYEAFQRFVKRQGALTALHWSVGAKDAKYIQGQLDLLGGTRGGPQRKYKILEADLKIADRRHPITFGIADFRINDEFYYRLDFVKPEGSIHPLLPARIYDHEETVGWSWERPDGGRSFGFTGIHFHSNWQRPEYRRLAVQGILWTLKLPIPNEGLKVDMDPKYLELKQPTE